MKIIPTREPKENYLNVAGMQIGSFGIIQNGDWRGTIVLRLEFCAIPVGAIENTSGSNALLDSPFMVLKENLNVFDVKIVRGSTTFIFDG